MAHLEPRLKDVSDKSLIAFMMSEHFDQFSAATVREIAESYVGLYASRPTSWLAALARNKTLNKDDAIAMEVAPALLRVPGMRRSKFLLPQVLAKQVFDATRLPLEAHEWRLKEEGLTLATYRKLRTPLRKMTQDAPVRLKDIKEALSLSGGKSRAVVAVATYEGVLVRSPPPNVWSNRWFYRAAPAVFSDTLVSPAKVKTLQRDLAKRYIRQYGPVSEDDLAWWMGIAKGLARDLINAAEATEVLANLWLDPSRSSAFESRAEVPEDVTTDDVRFLPAWDPMMMGYAPGGLHRGALRLEDIGGYDASGNGLPVVLINGRAMTTWRTMLDGKTRLLSVDLTTLERDIRPVIEAAAEAWAKRIGVVNMTRPHTK